MSKRWKFKGTVNITWSGELDIPHELEVEVDAYFTPGYTSGPPEDCYPPEGECEILSAELVRTNPKTKLTRTRKLCHDIIEHMRDNKYFVDRVEEAVADLVNSPPDED